MIRRRTVGAGVSALLALSFQLLLGAGAVPCTSMAHSSSGEGAQPSAEMAGMPMSDTGTRQGEHGDCGGQHTAPVCVSSSACAVAAIPAVGLSLSGAHAVDGLPAGVPATLRSALTDPDQPPPRA